MRFDALGYSTVLHPYGRTGPDLWAHKPDDRGHLVEVREKYPDAKGRYGLESPEGYEKPLLWRAADVLYLIWDTKRQGWYYAMMRELPQDEPGKSGSYHGGRFDETIPNVYWPAGLFTRWNEFGDVL